MHFQLCQKQHKCLVFYVQDIKTTEMDKVPGAEVQQEAAIFPQASEGAGESSNDEDGDFDEESENDSEKEDVIVENDLELHDISSSIN